jgi:hypothetical protein
VKTKGSTIRLVELVAIEVPRTILTVNLRVVLSDIFSVKVDGIVIYVSLLALAELIIESISESQRSLVAPPERISYCQEYNGLSSALKPSP